MSINWVMVSPTEPDGFIKLPNEKILYKSPPRTSLSLSTPTALPAAEPWSIKTDAGIVYITNQRIVYLPTTPSPELQSFSCPILNLQDTYVRAPFFGANYWTAVVRPVAAGGIPPSYPYVDLRMTFREGGAFDYHTIFEQIKERHHHAVQLAQDQGRNVNSTSGMNPSDLSRIDLEQLPAYEPPPEAPNSRAAGSDEEDGPSSTRHAVTRDSAVSGVRSGSPKEDDQFTPPNEPPPGYEEAYVQAVGIGLDQRLREEAERRGSESL